MEEEESPGANKSNFGKGIIDENMDMIAFYDK
jgi:hypothetical protein